MHDVPFITSLNIVIISFLPNHCCISRIEHDGPCCCMKIMHFMGGACAPARSHAPDVRYLRMTARSVVCYSLHNDQIHFSATRYFHLHCSLILVCFGAATATVTVLLYQTHSGSTCLCCKLAYDWLNSLLFRKFKP